MGTKNYTDLKHDITVAGIDKVQGRRRWSDGGFTDFVCLRFDHNRLTLRDIDQRHPEPKIHNIAHLRYVKSLSYGRERPRIVLWQRLYEDRPPHLLFPGISNESDDGEVIYSSNSLITYTLRQLLARGWLRFQAGVWQADIPATQTSWRQRANAILDFLQSHNRLHLYAGPGQPLPEYDDLAGVHPLQDLIPLDRLGYVREYVWYESPLAVFNTTYFLLEHNDFISHHSGLGQPYNMFVSDGVIQRPPLYRRSTLYQLQDGSWDIGMFDLEDIELVLAPSAPARQPLISPFVVDRPGPVTLYSRRWAIAGQNRVIGFTPADAARHEFTIVDRQVLSYKQGGGLEIPQNGMILSFDHEALTPHVQAALKTGRLGYRWRQDEHQGLRQAIQTGPRLLKNGGSVLGESSLAEESFWVDRIAADGSIQVGVVPSEYPDDVDKTRAGRVGIGVDGNGQLLVAIMMGAETWGIKHPELDSAGATLVDLTDLMLEMGAVQALNLDGGGSSQMFYIGGATVVPGNRLGLQTVHYERMIPSVGVVA